MQCFSKAFISSVLLLMTLAFSMSVSAQSSGTLSGLVVDETGAVIDGARVTAFDEKGFARATTVTKSDGTFAISGLPLGRYRVTAESTQFESGQIVTEIRQASATASVNLRLRVRPVNEEVTVTSATRSDVRIEDLPVSASVVTHEDVRDSAAQSLDQLLLSTPGVNLQEPPSFAQHPTADAVSMRGLGGERTLVLLDGLPLNDAFFGYVKWNRVPMEAIDHVEVVRGGASSLWETMQ